ncbi:PP0621 family protein [Rhodoferax sp.]|uniref:PP0621 family protein n=1 Tax=Rhodoferax sp. TaxID=50421 RepID=UPI00343A603D
MKLLLLVAVIVGVVWLWRNRPPDEPLPPKTAPPDPANPVNMTRCTLCGVHVPEGEICAGKNGVYCCEEHRHQLEP